MLHRNALAERKVYIIFAQEILGAGTGTNVCGWARKRKLLYTQTNVSILQYFSWRIHVCWTKKIEWSSHWQIKIAKYSKVGRGNLERGVTWNKTLSWASCTKMGAVRETLWGVVGGKSTYFLVVSCRVVGEAAPCEARPGFTVGGGVRRIFH